MRIAPPRCYPLPTLQVAVTLTLKLSTAVLRNLQEILLRTLYMLVIEMS